MIDKIAKRMPNKQEKLMGVSYRRKDVYLMLVSTIPMLVGSTYGLLAEQWTVAFYTLSSLVLMSMICLKAAWRRIKELMKENGVTKDS
jgi:hypothetical protein